MSADPVAIELREHDRRISGLHRTLGGLGTDVGDLKTNAAVSKKELDGLREDISDMRADMKWIKRGIWSAVAVGLMFVVAVSSLVIQIASGG